MKKVLDFLQKQGVSFKLFEHEAVFTNEESGKIDIPEIKDNAKNLFLRNHNKTQYYLVTLRHNKRADLKTFALKLSEKKLSFGSPEDLKNILDLTPGSVSPFGLLNDREKRVKFYLDKDFLTGREICLHPNINTGTVILSLTDFKKVIGVLGYEIYEFST